MGKNKLWSNQKRLFNSNRKEVNGSECQFKMGQSHGFKLQEEKHRTSTGKHLLRWLGLVGLWKKLSWGDDSMSILNISEQILVGFAGGRLCLKPGMEQIRGLSYSSYMAADPFLKTPMAHHATWSHCYRWSPPNKIRTAQGLNGRPWSLPSLLSRLWLQRIAAMKQE